VKTTGILSISLALNLVLAAALVGLNRQRPAAPANPLAPARQSSPVAAVAPSPMAANAPGPPSHPTRFHWGFIESADYREYIANLRRVGCPERLIRDIIIADVAKLYASRMRELGNLQDDWKPWYGSERRQARNRERSARVNALQSEQRALIKELLGVEWTEQWDALLHDQGDVALLLGFLPEPKPSQFFAMIEDFSEATREVNEKARGILLAEDREQLAGLRQALMTKFGALLTPAEFEELSLRAQSMGKFTEGDFHLDGVTLSGPEFRDLCGLSRITGDVIQDELFRDSKDMLEEEEERRQKAFEAEVKKLLGPARFADFERAQQSEFREAFEFTEEHHLPASTAARISDALRNAQEQAGQIKSDPSLSPAEQTALLTLLKSTTVNSLSSALGSNYPEYARTQQDVLDELTKLPAAGAEANP